MLFGLILGATNELLHAWPTADWASKGQPFFDRWINRQIWFLYGFIPGAIIGTFVGFVWYRVSSKNNEKGNL